MQRRSSQVTERRPKINESLFIPCEYALHVWFGVSFFNKCREIFRARRGGPPRSLTRSFHVSVYTAYSQVSKSLSLLSLSPNNISFMSSANSSPAPYSASNELTRQQTHQTTANTNKTLPYPMADEGTDPPPYSNPDRQPGPVDL